MYLCCQQVYKYHVHYAPYPPGSQQRSSNQCSVFFQRNRAGHEDKVGKITGGVVDLQLKLNCYSIELCTYLSIYSTQLSVIEYIVLCILQILLLLPYYAGSHCQPCEKARQD